MFRHCVNAGPLRARDLQPRADGVETGTLAESERGAIEAALLNCDRIEDAARELGIGRTALWRKMRQYNIVRLPVAMRRR